MSQCFYRTIFEIALDRRLTILRYDNTGNLLLNNVTILAGETAVGEWKAVHVTVQPAANITVNLDTGLMQTRLEVSSNLSTTSGDYVTIGAGLTGLVQDLRVYTPALTSDDNQVVVPVEGPFLPQCLCPPDLMPSLGDCINDTSTITRCVYI